MKIGRFLINGKAKRGVIEDDKVIINEKKYDMNTLTFLPPSSPKKIICAGLNYLDHAKELGMKIPEEPIIFFKPTTALTAHKSKIILPHQSRQVDYEAELAVVIGKNCKNVKREKAAEYILGFTCFNDVTARDLQKKDIQWARAKSFDTFAPVGPWIATKGEINAENLENLNLKIKLRKNGKTMQDSHTGNLIFGIPYLVEFVSSIMTLERGDIIATGTPPGVGKMENGDKIEVIIEKIGTLRNYAMKKV